MEAEDVLEKKPQLVKKKHHPVMYSKTIQSSHSKLEVPLNVGYYDIKIQKVTMNYCHNSPYEYS